MSSVPSVYPILHNARFYAAQRLMPRAGMSVKITTGGAFDQTFVHSIRRLNDATQGTFARIVGAGTKLYLASSGAAIDTGYSGLPLSLVPIRPSQSPRPWMYVGNGAKMRKVLVDGTNFQMGIAPPLLAPSAEIGTPAVNSIDDFEVVGSWTPGGTAGSLSSITRFSYEPSIILFDDPPPGGSGLGTGWGEVVGLNSGTNPFSSLVIGDRLTVQEPGESEIVTVQDVIPAAFGSLSTTTAAIQYDSGPNGLCTVTLTLPPTIVRANLGYDPSMDNSNGPSVASAFRSGTTNAVGIRRNSVVTIGEEAVRVLSVSNGPNGTVSFRCFTWLSHAPGGGETVTSNATFRAFFTNSYRVNVGGSLVDAVVFSDKGLQSTIGPGTGTISEVTPLNLGIVAGQSVPIQEDDYISLAFLIDNAANLIEVRLIFDVDSTTNDFQHTYYFKSYGPNDIQQALAGNSSMQTGRQTAYSGTVTNENTGALAGVQRKGAALILNQAQANDPANLATSTGTNIPRLTKSAPIGLGRWINLRCKVSELTKVGTDSSATLAGVQGVRIQITVAASAVCAVDSLWIGGCYGPDIGQTGVPYLYRYRGRSSTTGAKGLASPATRYGLQPQRQTVEVDLDQHPDPQVDLLDVYRWGGTLPQWTYLGSIANAPTPTFLDVFADSDISSLPQLDTDTFQPFPTVDIPRKGTCNVVGTAVTQVTGDTFNPRWYPGAQILINGIVFTLYAQPSSATQLQLVENAGTLTGATFQIPEATLLAQPLPALWGPYQQGTGLFCFACGDTFQPGVLFLTNGNDPDSASDVLQIEITSPSEPLMNGCMYGGQSYCWSSDRLFSLYPAFGAGLVVAGGELLPAEGTNLFVPIPIVGSVGLFAQFAICSGSRMWWRGRDGIYSSTGGAAQLATKAELSLLFPHDGQPGTAVTVGTFIIYPPDDTQLNRQRLSEYNGFLYFDYQDTQGNMTSLVYDIVNDNWSKDDYSPQVATHYGEEGQGINSLLLGGIDGNIYQASGNIDAVGGTFPFEARMPNMSELSGSLQHVRDGWLGLYQTPNGGSLVINVDGIDSAIALPAVTGYQRIYTVLPALKGRIMAFGLLGFSTFTGLVQRDCEFRVKRWADADYTPINPFSRVTRAMEPKIQ